MSKDIFRKLGEDAFLLGQLKGLQDACRILDNAYYDQPVDPSSMLERHILELEAEAKKKGLFPDDSQK